MGFIILCNTIQAFTLHVVSAVDVGHMANLFDVCFSVPDPVCFSVHYIHLFRQLSGFVERTEIFKKHYSFLQNLGFPPNSKKQVAHLERQIVTRGDCAPQMTFGNVQDIGWGGTSTGLQQADARVAVDLPIRHRTAPSATKNYPAPMSVVPRMRNPVLEKQAETWPNDLGFKTRELAYNQCQAMSKGLRLSLPFTESSVLGKSSLRLLRKL